MERYKEEFIEFMIECNVLKFGDFVTKSGRNTPFFINTGNYTTGSQLSKLGQFYAKAINEYFGENVDVLFGPAYKGIPLTVTTAISMNNMYNMNVSYCSNRKEVKDHGEGGVLLGSSLSENDNVVIVEDVMTAGTSIYETMPILKSNNVSKVQGIIISVDRMEKGKGEVAAQDELFEKFNVKTYSIVTIQEVVNYLHNKPLNGVVYITDEIKEKIDNYYSLYGYKK